MGWLLVVLAWLFVASGSIGPYLGGDDPGIEGTLGFALETIAAMWVQGGVVAALLSLLLCAFKQWKPAIALALVSVVALVPQAVSRLVAPAAIDATLPSTSRGEANERAASSSARRTLRIATFNLAGQNHEDPGIEAAIRRLDADILVLPEMTTWRQEQLRACFADDYPHRWLAAPAPERGVSFEGLQLAVWSRLPAAGPHEVVEHLGLDTQLRVPFRWQGRDFVLYGIHANKPWPRGLYRSCFRGRKQIVERIRREKGTVVVAGDFNATPRSAFLARFGELGLRNASLEALGYAPSTWPMHKWQLTPFRVAIDHVLVGEGFEVLGFGRGLSSLSDHAPVLAELRWR